MAAAAAAPGGRRLGDCARVYLNPGGAADCVCRTRGSTDHLTRGWPRRWPTCSCIVAEVYDAAAVEFRLLAPAHSLRRFLLERRASVGRQFCSVTAGDIFSVAYRNVDTFKVTNLK
jgi:hypothetical protein